MKFARAVFLIAGIWGIVVLTPLYWLRDITDAVPAKSPQFFYGFFAVALTWQLAFLAIAWNPIRLRPFMILGVIEKISYVITLTAVPANTYLDRRCDGGDSGPAAWCAVPRGVSEDKGCAWSNCSKRQ